MSATPLSGIARVVVRLPNWLGDLVMARRAVAALRAAHPNAALRAVAPASLVPLVEWDGSFERVHAWPADSAGRMNLAREVRTWRPDAALILPPSFSSAWWARHTGARVRVGFRSERRGVLLTTALARPERGARHLSEEYVLLAQVLGARDRMPATLPVPESAHAAARAALEGRGVRAPFALLGPGAIYGPAKRWGEDRFVAVGRALVARGDRVLVCGAKSDQEVCERVAAAIGDGAVSLAGHTDLVTQAGLCAEARVAVCNDSGLAHVCAAVGAPTVAVFGSTSSAWTAPLGARVRIVQHAPPCSPCFQRTCVIGYRCLTAVSAQEVLGACEQVAA